MRQRAYLFLGAAAMLMDGCSFSSPVTTKVSPQIEKYHVKTIAILPFEALASPQRIDPQSPELSVPGGVKGSNITVAIPQEVERYDHPTATVPAQAAEKVMQMVYGKLSAWEGIQVLSPSEVTRGTRALGPEAAKQTPEERAREVAERLSVDAALIGRVEKYRERVGSKLGADPAEVGFELRLLSRDGTLLWIGNYYERQRPFNEDALGFLRRRGVFVTAEELAEDGVKSVLRKFPFGAPPSKYVR
ncbi:MAG: hypothetical protein ACREIS_00215 [Nitrospiraceae bacterium]